MNMVTALAFPLSVISIAAGILGAYGLRFPMLPEPWSDVFSIALSIVLLASGIALSKTVSNALKTSYESFLQRRYPEAVWLWRGDWRQRISRAESFPFAYRFATPVLLGTTSLVIALATHFSPLDLLIVDSMVMTTFVIWCLALIGLAAVLKQRNNLNVLRFLSYPAVAGGKLRCNLAVARHGEPGRWEAFLVCERIVIESQKYGRRYVTCERLEEVWRSGMIPKVVGENHDVCISLEVDLPSDALPTGRSRNSMIKWRMIVRGISRTGEAFYERTFLVPIAAASRAATDMCWDRIQLRKNNHEFDDLDNILTAREDHPSPHDPHAEGPIWKGLADGLAMAQIVLSRGGIRYGERVWRQTPTFSRAVWGSAGWAAGMLVLAGIVATNVTWTLAIGISYLVALIGIVIGLVQSLYHVCHRFDLVFDCDALLVHHRCLGKYWKHSIPWALFETVTWERLGLYGHIHRRVVINADDSRWRRALSPTLRDGLIVDNLIDALELCRAMHQSTGNPVRISWPVPQALVLDSARVPGYSPSPIYNIN